MASRESKKMSTAVEPMLGHSQATKRIIQILDRLEKELLFSRSLSSMMICEADMEDSSWRARHCSVLRMSRRWQPYSFFSTIGSDSARLTLAESRLTAQKRIY